MDQANREEHRTLGVHESERWRMIPSVFMLLSVFVLFFCLYLRLLVRLSLLHLVFRFVDLSHPEVSVFDDDCLPMLRLMMTSLFVNDQRETIREKVFWSLSRWVFV
jgi:hypothetical protein